MNKLETNALRIAELMGYELSADTYSFEGRWYYKSEIRELFYSYDGLMPIVFESNNTDCEIHLYSSCIQLNTDEIIIFDYTTEPEFIEALQLACIKYLELKNDK